MVRRRKKLVAPRARQPTASVRRSVHYSSDVGSACAGRRRACVLHDPGARSPSRASWQREGGSAQRTVAAGWCSPSATIYFGKDQLSACTTAHSLGHQLRVNKTGVQLRLDASRECDETQHAFHVITAGSRLDVDGRGRDTDAERLRRRATPRHRSSRVKIHCGVTK